MQRPKPWVVQMTASPPPSPATTAPPPTPGCSVQAPLSPYPTLALLLLAAVQDTEQWGEQDVYAVVTLAGHHAGRQEHGLDGSAVEHLLQPRVRPSSSVPCPPPLDWHPTAATDTAMKSGTHPTWNQVRFSCCAHSLRCC